MHSSFCWDMNAAVGLLITQPYGDGWHSNASKNAQEWAAARSIKVSITGGLPGDNGMEH